MKTTFVDKQTVIKADWLNEVNVAVFDAIGDGTNAPTTPAEVKANLGIPSGPIGDVVGPASAIDNFVPLWNLGTGKLLKNSTINGAWFNQSVTSAASPTFASPSVTSLTASDAVTALTVTQGKEPMAALQTVPIRDVLGHLAGYRINNNITDATNDIDIATGVATDSTGVAAIRLTSALTKRLDANWAVGTNQGMLSTGSIANTTYHIFAILRTDTGVVDILADVSPTAPTLPANYTLFRRIASIVRTGGAIKPFYQFQDTFMWRTQATDVSAAANTAVTLRTLTVPTGIKVGAILLYSCKSDTVSNNCMMDPDASSVPASGSNSVLYQNITGEYSSVYLTCNTNTSAQVNTSSNGANALTSVITHGYVDYRGRGV